jgi:hypothetical protein
MVRPTDLSTHAIEAALRPLGDYLSCDQCKQLLRERINNLVGQWSTVKVSVRLWMYPPTFDISRCWQRTV